MFPSCIHVWRISFAVLPTIHHKKENCTDINCLSRKQICSSISLAFRPCIITWYITIVNSPEDVLLLAHYLPISWNTGTKRFSFSQDSARWMINYSCRQQLYTWSVYCLTDHTLITYWQASPSNYLVQLWQGIHTYSSHPLIMVWKEMNFLD